MMRFENHPVRLEHINTRVEFHGEEERLALDLTIKADLPNTALDDMSPTLRSSLYEADRQPDIVDPDSTPVLRNPQLGTLHWAGKFAGVKLALRDEDRDGLGDLRFVDARLDRVHFQPKDGGTCSFIWHIHVYPDDEATTAHTVYFLRRPHTLGTMNVPDPNGIEDEQE
ncbi:hypothetical protein HDG34_005622 [Paraburkholderia sp. HC6.4b]|uniref:hypothetical protein n=1 Tax=unclassified Paraburkholderia TaxID=2615204 RepID=UPI00160FB523|nr:MULTISPECIES: hypothetical protein [unclassified Paraburkholderia]MBB5411661.1 hypothetical protein [Paraburkholderia sp. HC6.4b]MBB5453310.1 hypothetical protein [Paraburkholderia sp. Kb1A]